ncbi:MAG TPA: putative DNA-binding domain-containing protein, partial [Methylotenera sp.]|nr:putative DNA-binding domain-containing protein [Methylotenera sp.]
QTTIGKRAWRALVKDFVQNYSAQSPIFREIPQQFLTFLNMQTSLPAFLAELAHYEWVELAVSAQPTEPVKLSKKMNLLRENPVLAPAHKLLEYDFAVHKITKGKLPRIAEKTYFLVFRNAEFEVKFIELNPITFQLLKLIEKNELTGEQALIRLAESIQHPNVDAVIAFGAEILNDLANQQAIIGSN